MEKNELVSSVDLYREIIDRVVSKHDSPFQRMMRKAKDIDLDYFEKVAHGGNRLSAELNMELKDYVVEEFSRMADELFSKELGRHIIADVLEAAETVFHGEHNNAYVDFIDDISRSLTWYVANEMVTAGQPMFSNDEVRRKYKSAKKITLEEFIKGTNYKDVIDFYTALMDNTWWACRVVAVDRTRCFLTQLADDLKNENK